MRYWVQCNTFDMGDLKGKALKPLEEVSEAREAVQAYGEARDESAEKEIVLAFRRKAVYECCDTLQATLNLLAALGVSQDELDASMRNVHSSNVERRRYE